MYNLNYCFVLGGLFAFFVLSLFMLLLVLEYLLIALIFLDLLLLTNILLLVCYTIFTGNPVGYCYGLLLIGVAAADTAVGLGLFIMFFKATGAVDARE